MPWNTVAAQNRPIPRNAGQRLSDDLGDGRTAAYLKHDAGTLAGSAEHQLPPLEITHLSGRWTRHDIASCAVRPLRRA